MGLDQYIFRVSRPERIDINKTYKLSELADLNYSYSLKNDSYDHGVAAILPYCVEIHVETDDVDTERIIKDFNLPVDSHITRINETGITVGAHGKSQSIPCSLLNEKYTIKQVKTAAVWKVTETQYWRKNYALQDWVYDNVPNADNVTYCPLTSDQIDGINQFGADIPELDPDEDGCYAYYEWY